MRVCSVLARGTLDPCEAGCHTYKLRSQLHSQHYACAALNFGGRFEDGRSRFASTRIPAPLRSNRIGKKWRALGDDFRTFLDDFVAAISTVEAPIILSL